MYDEITLNYEDLQMSDVNHYDPNNLNAILGNIFQQLKNVSGMMVKFENAMNENRNETRESERKLQTIQLEHAACAKSREKESERFDEFEDRLVNVETFVTEIRGPRRILGLVLVAVLTSLITGIIVFSARLGAKHYAEEEKTEVNQIINTGKDILKGK